ncbi:ABC transporter ATP-binding protein [Macrococcus bovicus]|uniref:ABC transporter ATP-binding protein n=1 Tax=Macrococcus bovicus TaxID=69968 RepID=A0A4R6C1M8_9STAP|nr:ABC transporter ATP-binding protein [Macrococcus bovicus]TDM14906.1 ABC transporter ATP-binding protein [Macrococcus bovicus]WJP98478.1 ABC transporter ATP-binding protein [Macrococcus bovicus]
MVRLLSKVKVSHVSKVYDLNNSKKDKLISLFTFGNFYKEKPYYALRDVSFEVEAGDSVGIIGLNGSGKSTLSNILGEVTQATSGTIEIEGRSSLIAISAGLNNELTGVENIKMKCLMHGMSEKEVNEKFDDIVAFSELDEFIYQPIKSYSSGMRSRLGFAIAIHTEPDVLIVDEALSVGDETFSNKCIAKMREFQEKGVTIFFVSHSTSQIKKMCNKALWLQFGEVTEYGDVKTVTDSYAKYMRVYRHKPKEEQLAYKKEMIARQQERGEAFLKDKEKKSPVDYLIGFALTGLLAAGTYFQLFH